MRAFLGRGYITFNGIERRSDRYGTVRLFDGDDNVFLESQEYEGKLGRLVAVIVETRKCDHIGDVHRKIYPPKQLHPVGSEFVLGPEGELFFEHFGNGVHEKGQLEREDDAMMADLDKDMNKLGEALKSAIGPDAKVAIKKPQYGIVFKWEEDQKEYLVLVKWDDKGLPLPDEVDDVPEAYFDQHKNMPPNEIHIIRISPEESLEQIATATVSHNEFEGTVQKMMEDDPGPFGALMVDLYRDLPEMLEAMHGEYEIVGIRPVEERKTDWMDPHQLFQVLQQTVDLYFEPSEKEDKSSNSY